MDELNDLARAVSKTKSPRRPSPPPGYVPPSGYPTWLEHIPRRAFIRAGFWIATGVVLLYLAILPLIFVLLVLLSVLLGLLGLSGVFSGPGF